MITNSCLTSRELEGLLEPLNIRHVEGFMHVKSVMAQSLHIGMVSKFGMYGASSGVVFVTSPRFQRNEVRRQ
ncbi:hypothetical protein TNCV_4457141 [Trichonephila clavipes]|nr:hypothetical protein TNCV_4457141 [Trichonephila clavipes]